MSEKVFLRRRMTTVPWYLEQPQLTFKQWCITDEPKDLVYLTGTCSTFEDLPYINGIQISGKWTVNGTFVLRVTSNSTGKITVKNLDTSSTGGVTPVETFEVFQDGCVADIFVRNICSGVGQFCISQESDGVKFGVSDEYIFRNEYLATSAEAFARKQAYFKSKSGDTGLIMLDKDCIVLDNETPLRKMKSFTAESLMKYKTSDGIVRDFNFNELDLSRLQFSWSIYSWDSTPDKFSIKPKPTVFDSSTSVPELIFSFPDTAITQNKLDMGLITVNDTVQVDVSCGSTNTKVLVEKSRFNRLTVDVFCKSSEYKNLTVRVQLSGAVYSKPTAMINGIPGGQCVANISEYFVDLPITINPPTYSDIYVYPTSYTSSIGRAFVDGPDKILKYVNEGESKELYRVGDRFLIEFDKDYEMFYGYAGNGIFATLMDFIEVPISKTEYRYAMVFAVGQDYAGNDIVIPQDFRMNEDKMSDTCRGGFYNSTINDIVLPAFYELLPAAWQNIIGDQFLFDRVPGWVPKPEDNYDDDIFAGYYRKIWLMSEVDIFGSIINAMPGDTNYTVGKQLAYYAQGRSPVRKLPRSNGYLQPINYWTRSVSGTEYNITGVPDRYLTEPDFEHYEHPEIDMSPLGEKQIGVAPFVLIDDVGKSISWGSSVESAHIVPCFTVYPIL